MPRTVNDAAMTTKAARERLAGQHKAYWKALDSGVAIGYRKGKTGGAWLARLADPSAGGGYRQTTIAKADDTLKADGAEVLDYRQAEARAREWVARQNRIAAGLAPEPEAVRKAPYTVAEAAADYLADMTARGAKSVPHTARVVNAHVLPALGASTVAGLSRDRVRAWHRALATAPARLRAKAGVVKHRKASDDDDAPRRRRATANRVLTVLKAALNHARAEGKAGCSDDAWAPVKPFREADQPKVRYLLDTEAVRLVNACAGDFRALVTAALLTGCRYGELTALRCRDFDPDSATLLIGRSKSGKHRHVVLTDEGRDFLAAQVAGKPRDAVIFQREAVQSQATRTDAAQMKRVPWRGSDQFRPMRDACAAAEIEPAVSFHILRHTHASRLARASVPMAVIAAQLGHRDTRMTEKHYAHLAPSYIADTVRRAFLPMGLGTL